MEEEEQVDVNELHAAATAAATATAAAVAANGFRGLNSAVDVCLEFSKSTQYTTVCFFGSPHSFLALCSWCKSSVRELGGVHLPSVAFVYVFQDIETKLGESKETHFVPD